jgi:hypothetical protein
MIVPSDTDYKETKRIKQGKAALNSAFKPLADWIDKAYKVKVLNIYYDTPKGVHNQPFPRLNVIFEHLEEELKFRDGVLGNFHSDKQQIIGAKFEELLNNQPEGAGLLNKLSNRNKFDTGGLLVIFNAFKPVAKDEANENIPQTEIDQLKAELNNPDIWKIARFFAGTTFFFYTNRQAELAKSNGYVEQLTDKYFQVLKRYDEFNYFDRNTFSISADSKENFDNNFESNWYYYGKS